MKPTPMKYSTRSVQTHDDFYLFVHTAHKQTPTEISAQHSTLSGVIRCLRGLVLDV